MALLQKSCSFSIKCRLKAIQRPCFPNYMGKYGSQLKQKSSCSIKFVSEKYPLLNNLDLNQAADLFQPAAISNVGRGKITERVAGPLLARLLRIARQDLEKKLPVIERLNRWKSTATLLCQCPVQSFYFQASKV